MLRPMAKKNVNKFGGVVFWLLFYHIKQQVKPIKMKNENKIEQMNTYQVVYSDGVRILDYVYASNLNDAKKIAAENAKTKNYGTAYYKVARCYNGGVRGSSNETHWH